MGRRFLWIVLVACAAPVACSTVSSEDIAVRAMYFTMVLQKEQGSSLECYTRVSVSDEMGTSVVLEGGDTLTCNGVPMQKKTSMLGDYTFYVASLPAVADGTYEIRFFREGAEAARSVATWPASMRLLRPEPAFVHSLSQTLSVEWDRAGVEGDSVAGGDRVHATLTARRVGGDETLVLSSEAKAFREGALTIPRATFGTSDSLRFSSGEGPLTLQLWRTRRGQTDARIKGHFDADQSMSVEGSWR